MRYFYLRDGSNHRAVCVASELRGEGDDKRVIFQVVAHNPRDKFDPKVAWSVAGGRLKHHGADYYPELHVFGGYVKMGPLVKKRIVATIKGMKDAPQRIRDCATLWLEAHREDPGYPLVR